MSRCGEWKATDVVEIRNNITVTYQASNQQTAVNNPFARRLENYAIYNGIGGGLGASGFEQLENTNSLKSYSAGGGKYQAPYALFLTGPWSNGLAMQYAPLHQASSPCPNAAGSIISVCEIAPGAASQKFNIFNMGDQSTFISYDHSSSTYTIQAGRGSNLGSIVLNGYVNIAKDLSLMPGNTLNWNSDTGFSRTAASTVALGNGTAGDASGSMSLANLTGVGTTRLGSSGQLTVDVSGNVS